MPPVNARPRCTHNDVRWRATGRLVHARRRRFRRSRRGPRTAHDLIRAAPLSGREHDDSPAHMLERLRSLIIPANAIVRRDADDDPCSHARSMNCFPVSANPLNGAIH